MSWIYSYIPREIVGSRINVFVEIRKMTCERKKIRAYFVFKVNRPFLLHSEKILQIR